MFTVAYRYKKVLNLKIVLYTGLLPVCNVKLFALSVCFIEFRQWRGELYVLCLLTPQN